MRARAAVLVLALALTGCIFAVDGGDHSPRPEIPPGPYGLEVSILAGEEPGTWTCTAVMFDLPSGRSVMSPRLMGKVGEPAEVTSASGPTRLTLRVRVETGGQADWTAEIVTDGLTVGRQQGSVKL